MAAPRTEITEIVTGLAMLGAPSLDEALSHRPPELLEVDDDVWTRLVAAHRAREHEADFLAAWNNGRAFLASPRGLRGRPPLTVEWTGGHRDPGDVVVPADLRVDHVYLVSCKYLSRVLHNASPAALFENVLSGPSRRSDADWFDRVAPREHQELYRLVRQRHAPDLALPESVAALTKAQRRELRARVPRDWDRPCATAYAELTAVAARESARRWSGSLRTRRDRELMLWRLLRLAPAPYFVLGTSRTATIRVRVDTPWDVSRTHALQSLDLAAVDAGQATIAWCARLASGGGTVEVEGHVELRWSHGRFGGPPEAKVYLDTPPGRVPGYVPLDRPPRGWQRGHQ